MNVKERENSFLSVKDCMFYKKHLYFYCQQINSYLLYSKTSYLSKVLNFYRKLTIILKNGFLKKIFHNLFID